MSVLVRLPGTGAMTIDVFHKVGESSCFYRERQCPADVVDIPVLIENQWPPLVICNKGT
jgi:hypothetical protein